MSINQRIWPLWPVLLNHHTHQDQKMWSQRSGCPTPPWGNPVYSEICMFCFPLSSSLLLRFDKQNQFFVYIAQMHNVHVDSGPQCCKHSPIGLIRKKSRFSYIRSSTSLILLTFRQSLRNQYTGENYSVIHTKLIIHQDLSLKSKFYTRWFEAKYCKELNTCLWLGNLYL